MNPNPAWSTLRAGVLLCPVFLALPSLVGQSIKPAIWLDPSEPPSAASEPHRRGEASFANAPANFHAFPSAHVGEDTYPEKLTLHFGASTKLTKIESTKDFQVEQSSSCAEGRFYSEGESCILLVHFTPQGPGRRLGKLKITHTGSAEPLGLGLGGNGYAPVISFTPAVITTVPGTYPASKGLLSGAKYLTVDGGDSLYIADSGNGIIRYVDSSGNITSLATGYPGATGIAVDNFGEVYFDLAGSNIMYDIFDYGLVTQASGSGTVGCPVSTPCDLNTEALINTGAMSIDPYNHLFFVDGHDGAAMATVLPVPAKLIFLYDPFPYQTNPPQPIAVDSEDNIYSAWVTTANCDLVRQSLYDAENFNQNFTKIAGGRNCGFTGDGGQAGNAEIGSGIGQMGFDIAGNLYFSDTANQRVRRIDATTGIINTIAGNGTAGYSGDGAQANQAQLSFPRGVAVDSQGQVYIISSAATGQVVRKLGPNGIVEFGNQLKGSASIAHLVTVSNTGNSAMTLTNAAFTGPNAGDFSIDSTTTSCLLTAGATLYSGQSCKIGFFFKPSASGLRLANFVLLDNTVTNTNTIQLLGVGTLPVPTFSITSPANGTSVAAGTAITFAVSVTSTTSPAPTGKVTMLLDGSSISGSPATLNGSGAAALRVVTSVTGTHTVSASYSGDANYSPAGPITRTYTVTAAALKPAAVRLSSTPNPAKRCSPVTFSVEVAGVGAKKPTGKVELLRGSTVVATADLNNGAARLTTSSLAVGANLLSARYAGDATHGAATSAVLRETVLPGSCNILQPMRESEVPVPISEPSIQ